MDKTPRTDDIARGNHVVPTEWAEQLERELDDANNKLTSIFRWIERHHSDGFIDSKSHTENLDRVIDRYDERLNSLEEQIYKLTIDRDEWKHDFEEQREVVHNLKCALAEITKIQK